MPELPEVETTRRGIAPHVEGRRIRAVTVRESRLRWPLAADFAERLEGARIEQVGRRAKYLLFRLAPGPRPGVLLLHLGMSGNLRLVPSGLAAAAHDHVDLHLDSGLALRFHDPRRFGSLQWTGEPPEQHPLLSRLGPEPLSSAFTAEGLYRQAQSHRAPIKSLLMNPRVVVGVGNIYACEALHRAGIHPRRPARRVGPARVERLVASTREVLSEAIAAGGTTLRDFLASDGRPGYFRLQLRAYGRAGEPCASCGEPLRLEVIAQRSTVFCARCQR